MSDLKIFTDNIEPEALNQIYTLIKQPAFSDCKVRIMPDVHSGAGCVIGFTADLGDKVIPNIVGVDIGCGMYCAKLNEKIIDLYKLDDVIKKYIPNGREVHDGRQVKFDKLQELYCYRELKDTKRLDRSIGTLGGGNHFIEIDVDEDENMYLVIHTGSRNLGKQVAEYYQNLAVEIIQGKDKLYEMQNKLIAEYKAAGRIMSRSEAKECVDIDEYIESMKYVHTTSVGFGTIDEAPMVYKPMQEIIDNIKDTVEIKKILKPIYNFKACE